MKNSTKLKSLVSISFLVFFLPFLRTCSDKQIESYPRKEVVEVEANNVKDLENIILSKNERIEIEKREKKQSIQEKNEYTFNFYQLNYRFFCSSELKLDDFKDKTFYPFLGFFLIFINHIFLAIFTFANKSKISYNLAILNLALLIFSTIALYFSDIVENIKQFKIGYYLFALNSILIFLLTNREIQEQRNYS